jgi:DNA-binding CsgD family transcriptional regulator
MGRNTPADGEGRTVAPISDDVIESVAEDMDYDVDPDTVRTILDAFQTDASEVIGLYREGDSRVVAEDADVLVTLSKWDYSDEIDQFLDGRFDELAADALGVDPSIRREVVFQAVSYAHHSEFESARRRSLTGFPKQDVTGATATQYPRVLRKPDEAKPAAGDQDVWYRIRYEHGYERAWNFVAHADGTVTGDMGKLRIERTYRAIPDDDSDEEPNVVRVWSEVTHVESHTLVSDYNDTFTFDEFGVDSDQKGGVDQFDADLRCGVYQHHTADFEVEYEQLDDVIQSCENCGAFGDHNGGVYVDQRPSYSFNPARKDTLCNHCFAAGITDATLLSRQEAEVQALKDSGLSHTEVSDTLGIERSTVGSVISRISDKAERAIKQEQKAKATSEIIDID